LDQLYSSRRT